MNQPPQGQPAQAQQSIRLLKPENMRNVAYLTPEEKQKYEDGLRQLWNKMEQNGPETLEHQAARQKVADFSRMVMNKIRTIQARNQGGAQGQPGQPGQPGGGQPQPGQPSGSNSSSGQAHGAPTPVPRPAMPPSRPQGPPTTNNAPNAPNAGASAPNATASTTQVVPKNVLDHINKLPWGLLNPPSQIPQEQVPKWLGDTKQRYLRCLLAMESVKSRLAKLDAMFKDRQEKGQQMSPEDVKRANEQRASDQKMYTESDKFVRSVRNQMQAAQQAGQNVGAQGQNNAQQARSQPMQAQNSGNTGNTASSHPMQVATASVNAAMDAAKNQQLAAANRAGSAGQPQLPQTPATPATPSTSAPQQQPHPAPAAPQAQVKIEPGSHVQHPPPVNTALAAASSANLPSAGTPTQGSARVQTPQSSIQQQQQQQQQPQQSQPQQSQAVPGSQVRPLSHAAAVNRANSSTNLTGPPGVVANGGVTTTPGSGGLMGNASQHGHLHAHPQPNTSTLTSKLPIPKTLPEKATQVPTPVSVGGGNGPGRPTYGGGNASGGVVNQPVIPKMNTPQFDIDGDHVLSKKKLDELVRQVCGGASPGADGNYLTPDVEESVLNVADNFVDGILHTACRLAKERGSKVLEIRDIQLVLERVYNIRIPGYTSDELRTVRKVQPSSNWINKMSAVQAAKVMPGKDDK